MEQPREERERKLVELVEELELGALDHAEDSESGHQGRRAQLEEEIANLYEQISPPAHQQRTTSASGNAAAAAAGEDKVIRKLEECVVDTGSPSEVTMVVRHRVKPDKLLEFEQWSRRIKEAAHSFPGHVHTDAVRPTAGEGLWLHYVTFDNYDHLGNWAHSEERRKLIEESMPLAEEGGWSDVDVEMVHGIVSLFSPFQPSMPAAARTGPAPRWKQAILVWSMVFVQVLIINYTFGKWAREACVEEVDEHLCTFFITAMTTVVTVFNIAFFLSPFFTKQLASWLFAQPKRKFLPSFCY